MFVTFKNAPTIISEEGYIIDSVVDWVFYLKHNGLASNTIKQYVSFVNMFYEYELVYAKEKYTDKKEMEGHINGFLLALEEGNNILDWTPHGGSSINIAKMALYSYLAYSTGDDTIMKERRAVSRFEQEFKKQGMLGYLQTKRKTRSYKFRKRGKGRYRRGASITKFFPPEHWWDFYENLKLHRDKAFFCICLGTSARVGQALNVWVKDVLFDEEKIVFIDPRYDEVRAKELKSPYGLDPDPEINNKGPLPGVWLDDGLKKEFFRQVRLYFEKEFVPNSKRLNKHPYLFVTRTGNRLRPQYVRKKFGSTIAKIGLTGYTPHSLRHLYGYICAAHLGQKAEDIADNMGHANIESTRIYTKMPSAEAEDVLRRAWKKVMEKSQDELSEREVKSLKIMKNRRGNND